MEASLVHNRNLPLTSHDSVQVNYCPWQPAQNQDYSNHLADEDLIEVFWHLNLSDFRKLPLICRRWRNVSCDESLWKKLYQRYFCSEQELQHSIIRKKTHEHLSWRDCLIRVANLITKQFKIMKLSLGEEQINKFFYDEEDRLIIEKLAQEAVGMEQKKIELWDREKTNCIKVLPILIEKKSENSWEIKVTAGPLIYQHLYEGYKGEECPKVSVLSINQNQLILKVNHLSLFVMRLDKRESHYVQLLDNPASVRFLLDRPPSMRVNNLMFKEGQQLWVRDKNQFRLYDPNTLQWSEKIDLSDPNCCYSAAKIGNKIIHITNKSFSLFEIEEGGADKRCWHLSMANNWKGWNQKIVVPDNDTSYFGLYSDKTLTLYDVHNGNVLCQLTLIPSEKIRLTEHTIQYLDDDNKLVVQSFGPS